MTGEDLDKQAEPRKIAIKLTEEMAGTTTVIRAVEPIVVMAEIVGV
jgi:hypothetical protein